MEMESNHIARRFITDVPDDKAEGAWQRDDVSRIAPADLDPRGDDGGVVFTLRLPHDLHAALLRVAQQRSVSAHTVIIEAVAGYVSVQEDILEWGRRGGEEGNDDNTERRIVFIKPIGDSRFKQWVKVLEGVDTTISNGFAFQGNFIRLNQKGEFPVGTLLLYFGMEGSRRRQQACVELRVVTPNGLKTLYARDGLDQAWALDVRDNIADILKAQRHFFSAATGDADANIHGAASPVQQDIADSASDDKPQQRRRRLG
jgi:predicted transcriptional regulator